MRASAIACAMTITATIGSARADGPNGIDHAEWMFEQSFVAFDDEAVPLQLQQFNGLRGTQTVQLMVSDGRPYRGVQREPLPGASFYAAIDRPDLVARYRRRHRVRVGLAIGSGTAAAAGVTLAIAGISIDPSSREGKTYLVAGGLSAALSLGLLAVYLRTSNDPVDESAQRRLAAEYNARLHSQLGLRDDTPIQARPYVDAAPASISVGGRF